MSRHNQQRSVEEGRSLLRGAHAMKNVKPSVDILKGLLTGVSMDVTAPHLIHKWLNESRLVALVHAGRTGLTKCNRYFFVCAPRPSMP